MPDPDAAHFERARDAGQTSIDRVLDAGGYSTKSVITVRAANVKQQSNFFVMPSWTVSGRVTMTFTHKIDLRQYHKYTMAVLGPNNGRFMVQKSDHSFRVFNIKTKLNPVFYANYTPKKGLAKSLKSYLENERFSTYDTTLKQANVAKDDILFCIVSPNGKGAIIKDSSKDSNTLKMVSISGKHSATSQSILGYAYMIKKGDLSKVTVDIPKGSKSYGFFIRGSAINTEYPQNSNGCWFAFSSP